ncbi:hypothetical protein K438DRAFT_1767775 [Mycena galopus ATCC 62051]|nr:hypothetical protein K438DRAFT_1767775 [Mycena galopus ATCC 62051]
MKRFNKLSIVIVSVLVTSVAATVNLCCAAIEQTNLGLLTELGYTGDVPIDICEGCTPLEDSCELLASTCETSLADNTVGINCAPADFTVPPGGVELCCAQIVSTDDELAKQLLDEAGYDGSDALDVALGCIQVSNWPKTHRSPLLDLRCQEALLDNVVGVTCIPAASHGFWNASQYELDFVLYKILFPIRSSSPPSALHVHLGLSAICIGSILADGGHTYRQVERVMRATRVCIQIAWIFFQVNFKLFRRR